MGGEGDSLPLGFQVTEDGTVVSSVVEDSKVYRCPSCRMNLFSERDIIPHDATKERPFFKKRGQAGGPECACSTYFIEKPKWFDARGRISDAIVCCRCGYKLGRFSWIGSQCSCGEWVKPAFQVPKSRVDSF